MPEKPLISVIMASYNSSSTITRSLASLLAQRTEVDFEVIVVDSSSDGTGDLVEREFPQVRLFRYASRKYPGSARNIGIAQSKGAIIAFIDADCLAANDWIANISKAHELPYPAIGGAVGNVESQNATGWAAYFCEFNKWMPGTPPQWMDDVPSTGSSYKLAAFDRYGTFAEGCYGSDTHFNWRLKRDHAGIWFEPSIQVYHIGLNDPAKLLRHEFFHGRSYARVRVKEENFSLPKRWLYVVLTPLIFFRLLSRATLQSMRTKIYWSQFLGSIHMTVPTILSWTLGEMISYARGR